MKEYIKPTYNVIELKPEETFAAGSGTVMPNSINELTVLEALGLDTSIFIKQ